MAAKKSSARKPAKPSARKPAKKSAARATSRPAAKAAPAGGSGGVVYSDVRRDTLAWQLSKLR